MRDARKDMIEGTRLRQLPVVAGRLFKLVNNGRRTSFLRLHVVLASDRSQLRIRAQSSKDWAGILRSTNAIFRGDSVTSNSLSIFLVAHGEGIVLDWADGSADDGTTTEW